MAVDRYALTVGINRYADPNSNLSGCVNDAVDWGNLLRQQGYKVTTLLDNNATRDNVLSVLRNTVVSLGYRDRFVFTYSGHGSWVPDLNGDEIDGRDEVLVMHDFKFISDDDLYPIFSGRAFGSRVAVLSDSCHSGSVTRFAGPTITDTRFLNPVVLGWDTDTVEEAATRDATRFGGGNSGVLISGCKDDEYSYDAWFGSRPNGAFTRAAIDSWEPGLSYREWHERIALPTDQYPQSPQLQGTYYQKRMWDALD